MFVVDTSEDFGGDFVSLEEVMEVGFVVVFTTFTITIWHKGRKIVFVFGVFDIDAAVVSIERAVSGHASRADAVKCIATEFGADK